MRSNLKIKVVKKISEIPPHEWNKVYPPGAEGYYFFKTLNELDTAQFLFFYIMVYDNGTPIGAASCFIMDFPLDIAVEGIFQKITNFIKRLAPALLTPRILICGFPTGPGKIGIGAEPEKVVKAICEGLEEIAREENVGIIAFKDFASEYKVILDQFLDRDFLRIDSLPGTEMDISFGDFEQYLESLNSARRNDLKRKFKKVDGKVKIDLEITNKLEDGVVEDVHALYLQNYEKHEMGLEKLTPDFFRKIAKNMPDETRFFLWRINGQLAAFVFCLVEGERLLDYYLGFDYSVAYQYHLYFVKFRDLVKWCIENKIRKYDMGYTAYDAKRRLGFKLFPLYIYVKHRSKLLNPIFRMVCRIFQPSNFEPAVKLKEKR